MKKISILLIVIAISVIVVACSSNSGNTTPTGMTVKTVTVDKLTATLSNSTGQLKQGDQEVMLAFTDSTGKPVDVGAVSLNFHMPSMGTMSAMNEAVTFTTTKTPGSYQGKVNIAMAGEWQAQLAYEGPAGTGKTTFTVTAR
ncbi:MAG TPA: FixH family protein [Pyrinomonadaceae bacterium]|nr:FixH family protein [Pyrinomonadaceae bacterium]